MRDPERIVIVKQNILDNMVDVQMTAKFAAILARLQREGAVV
jgi:hypothetical protein